MNIGEKKIWKKCVEDILIFCLTHPIEYRFNSMDDSGINPATMDQLIDIYMIRLIKVFNKHEKNLVKNNLDEDEWMCITDEFFKCFGITYAMKDDSADGIDEILRLCISDIRKLYPEYKSDEYIQESVDTDTLHLPISFFFCRDNGIPIPPESGGYIRECVGTCCFCQGECNPMSQSCGRCSRGLSGSALGLPVPEHLRQFL